MCETGSSTCSSRVLPISNQKQASNSTHSTLHSTSVLHRRAWVEVSFGTQMQPRKAGENSDSPASPGGTTGWHQTSPTAPPCLRSGRPEKPGKPGTSSPGQPRVPRNTVPLDRPTRASTAHNTRMLPRRVPASLQSGRRSACYCYLHGTAPSATRSATCAPTWSVGCGCGNRQNVQPKQPLPSSHYRVFIHGPQTQMTKQRMLSTASKHFPVTAC